MNGLSLRRFFSMFASGAILAAAGSVALSSTVRTVALTGQPAAGIDDGANYVHFGDPVLNNAGRVAFYADLTDQYDETYGIALDQGIWSETSGPLALVARTGTQAPGALPDVTFRDFRSAAVFNDAGQTAFFAQVTDGANDENDSIGIWSDASGILSLVAGGGPTISAGGTIFPDFVPPVLNNAGQMAFRGFEGGDDVIWSEDSGTVATVARLGDQAPGMPAGVIFGRYPSGGSPFHTPAINDAGQVAFRSAVSGSGIDGNNNVGVWVGTPGNLELVVRSGDPAPGMWEGTVFSGGQGGFGNGSSWFGFGRPSLNSVGQIVFYAETIARDGIWMWSEGSGVTVVARHSQQAPGTPEGVLFSTSWFSKSPALNDAGDVALYAQVFGPGVDFTNDGGIWRHGPAGLQLIAREGEHAAGTASGVTFLSISNGAAPALNEAGQVAFTSRLTGSGVNNDVGIWATDRDGELQLIARTGDVLEVAPGDFRTIGSVRFIYGASTTDGTPLGFNDLGQLAFLASFTDGSHGIFVSNLVAAIEPDPLPGDYSDDGIVDAADYTVWRDSLGAAAGTLPNDIDGGEIGPAQYNTWKANFGATSSVTATASGNAVPEPGTLSLAGCAAFLSLLNRRRSTGNGPNTWYEFQQPNWR